MDERSHSRVESPQWKDGRRSNLRSSGGISPPAARTESSQRSLTPPGSSRQVAPNATLRKRWHRGRLPKRPSAARNTTTVSENPRALKRKRNLPLQERGWCPQIELASGHAVEDDLAGKKGHKLSL